jgi:hypothetical protein
VGKFLRKEGRVHHIAVEVENMIKQSRLEFSGYEMIDRLQEEERAEIRFHLSIQSPLLVCF